MLIPIQELTLALDSGETAIAEIRKVGPGDECIVYSSEFQNLAPSGRMLRSFPLEARSVAPDAFRQLLKGAGEHAAKSEKKVVSVDNPNNCELLPASEQQAIAGPDIRILVNGRPA